MKDEAGEAKQDAKQLQQLDQLGDKAEAEAQKDPEQKNVFEKIVSAGKAVTHIINLVGDVQKKIYGEFQAAASKGDQAKMKERYDYFVKFGDFADQFIEEAKEAYAKGSSDPKQYDEVIAMAAKYGFKG